MIFGVFTSMNLFSEKKARIILRILERKIKILEILGLRKSKALLSSLVSKSDSTLPVGSIGKETEAFEKTNISLALISIGKFLDFVPCTNPVSKILLCLGIDLAFCKFSPTRTV